MIDEQTLQSTHTAFEVSVRPPNYLMHHTGSDGGNPRITFDKNTRAIERTIDTFDNVVKRIELKDFTIRVRPHKLCGGCAMKAYCDKKNWQFREQRSELGTQT